MTRESFIVAVSGQPTKNLGATIINAGNTPAGIAGTNDATNNNAGFGVLTGANTGKSSGSKVVERDGSTSHPSSGVSISAPGVQAASTSRQFASPTEGSTTSKTLTTGQGAISKYNVSWRNVLRQYPTVGSPDRNHTQLYKEYGPWINAVTLGGNSEGHFSVKRDERSEFGNSVQIAKQSSSDGGIILSVGAPSGTAERSGTQTDGGYVDTWQYQVLKMPSIPGEEGTIDEEGFGLHNTDETCSYAPGQTRKQHCPGWLNGYTRIGTRIFQNNQSERGTALDDKRHRVVVGSGAGVGHCIAYNSDATRMAVGMPYANDETGEVRVYEFVGQVPSSGNVNVGRGIWARCGGLITGNQKGDRFGYSVAIDGIGNTLFVGAPRPKGSGYVSVQEYSSNVWSGAAGSSSGVSPRDRYGHSLTCNSAGTAYAVGAPWGSGTRGYTQVFANFGSWMTTRRGKYTAFRQSQQAAQDNGKTKVQRIVGTASGERLGWSVDMMYRSVPSTKAGKYNLRLAIGSPYWSSSVEGYDFSKRTFAERAAGVPISDGNLGSQSGAKPWDSQDWLENGIAYDKVGLSSEGKVSVWGYSGPEMTQTSKFAYSAFEFIQFGRSSSKDIMTGLHLSELGYSVKMSDDGDFVAAGAPGMCGGIYDPSDCDAVEETHSQPVTQSGEAPPLTPKDCDNPFDSEIMERDAQLGTGAVRCFRYLWKGSDGDDARKQHNRSESDFFIKFGNTLRGVDTTFAYTWHRKNDNVSMIVRDHRYKRPNFQDRGKRNYSYYQPGERFGTSLALFAEFAIGNVMYPHLAVGAPFAMDIKYMNNQVRMHNGLSGGSRVYDSIPYYPEVKGSESYKYAKYTSGAANYYPYRTGRIDLFLGVPKLDGDAVMPFGAGRKKTAGSISTGSFTKPKFEYLPDGKKIVASGVNDAGGRQSYFIAPNVSGSGLADDNALKTNRKTFGTGGINFTSSD